METKKLNNVKRVKIDFALNVNYNDLFKSWVKPLQPLLTSAYLFNLMAFLHKSYETLNIRPRKNQIFKAFELCPYDKLKVVVISREPYNNIKSTGIPFANRDTVGEGALSGPLQKYFECVERTVHEGFKLNKDPSLEYLPPQGVLMLNASLTSVYNKRNKHALYWKNFTREVIKTISNDKDDIVFIFLGTDARYFSKYVDAEKHNILEFYHPEQAVRDKAKWYCESFKRANKIIAMKHGKDAVINW